MSLLFQRLVRLAVAIFVCGAASAQIRVLLIEGASNHDWQSRVEILESIVSRDGGFEMDVSLAPATDDDPNKASWSPDFSSYDVVISGYPGDLVLPGMPKTADWPAAVKTAFEAYVAGGGGFMAFHEATQGFRNWTEYQNMIGLGWRDGSAPGTAMAINPDESLNPYPAGSGFFTGHGARADSLVKRLGNHPVHAGLPASCMAADIEVVSYPRGPAQNLTILSYALDPDPISPGDPQQWPVEWVVNYGSGRVYASTYGHLWSDQAEPEGMRCAAFQETFLRALRWCAGVNPPSTVPADFPGTESPVLRPHTEGFAGFGGAQAVGPFANNLLPTSSFIPTDIDVVPAFTEFDWESPIDARPWPGGGDQMLIVEMDGRFFKLADDDATTSRSEVLDIQDRAWYMNWDFGSDNTKHGGVMSCAFHPQFGTGMGKDFLYVFYLHHPNDDPDSLPPFYQRVSRFTWTGSSFDPASEQILIQQYDTTKGHEGGSLVFGADGYLYITFGDEGTASDDAVNHTQRLDDRVRSGVWRIDVDQIGGSVSHPIRRQPYKADPSHLTFTQNYYIPSDNPWVDENGDDLEEFYALGLREPHRMSYDPITDAFWIGDVGAGVAEEVDVMDGPGLNFQWSYKEGASDGPASEPASIIGTERGPIHEFGRDEWNCIIGGFVYRGSAIPELVGKYIFGENSSQQIRALDFDAATMTANSVSLIGKARDGIIWNGIGSFGVDTQGELLVLQMGAGVAGGGTISRLRPPGFSNADEWQYPDTLTETGLFTELPLLTPAPGLIPYEVNSPLWSDGMVKKRWVMLPSDGVPSSADEIVTYREAQSWDFPVGTVFVKHFERPDTGQFLETRLLVHGTDGWGGVTYKWRPDGLEADRLEEGFSEELTLDGQTFDYVYPSRVQCLQCHTEVSGRVLGFRAHQLNRSVIYPNGRTANQIESFSAAGFFDVLVKEEDLTGTVTAAGLSDTSATPEWRVRSYLDSNCAHCHQPGAGSRAFFDARLTTPVTNQSLICGPVIEGLGVSDPAVIKPGSLDNSVLFQRLNSDDICCRMPPIGKGLVDDAGVVELANWILSMTPDSCSKSQSFFDGGTLGDVSPSGTAGSDPAWFGHMVIDESSQYSNTGNQALKISLNVFRYEATASSGPLTPFVVRVDGDDSFTVLSIGETRNSHVIGVNEVSFRDDSTSITLDAGDSMAFGFFEANADGSGSSDLERVRWSTGSNEIWHGGGGSAGQVGSLLIGSAPDPGNQLSTTESRQYHVDLDFIVIGMQLGNDVETDGSEQVDGATSNFVINLGDAFTHSGSEPLTVSIDEFSFHASRVTDPVTPFLVRWNGPEDMQVVAIGTPQTAYAVGVNRVPFSEANTLIRIEPGETIAPAFTDNLPDGSGGSQNGAVSFFPGGDSVFYRYNYPDHTGNVLTVGQAPVVNAPYGEGEVSNRDYLFAICLGFGGPEDEDGDGLKDSWEEVFALSLGSLSANGDFDGDGQSDMAEQESGTDPTDASSRFQVIETGPDEFGGVTVEFSSLPGRSYGIRWSQDLSDWIDAGTITADAWPAEMTRVQLPASAFDGGVIPDGLFIQVETQ